MELQTIILCGGLGTRMGASAETIPKPMVQIGGRPLLWHIMKGYAAWGCRRFILCLGHKGDAIRAWFMNGGHLEGDIIVGPGGQARRTARPGGGSAGEWQITLAETGPLSTTGDRLLQVRRLLDPDRPAFMTYGDGVADVDLGALLARHREGGRLATVSAMRPRSRFGVLELDGDRVRRFEEKPMLDVRVSGGFFVFEPAAFEWLRPGEPLEAGALERLAAADQLSAHAHDGFWFSVDTPRDLAELERLWRAGTRPWLPPGQ